MRLITGSNIDYWNGAAVILKDVPGLAYIFINTDKPPFVQKKTMRHELWHILHDMQKTDPDERDQAEEEAERHENDQSLDSIIAAARLWERAVKMDAQGLTEAFSV